MANYSRPSSLPAVGAHSILSLFANFNAANGSLVTSSLGMGGQVENYWPPLTNSQAMLASTSNQSSDAPNAAIDQNTKTLITGTLGLSAAGTPAAMDGSSSTQETALEKSSHGGKPETVGQPSIPAISSIPHTNPEMDNNEEVSPTMKDSHIEDTDEDGEQRNESEKTVGENLSENNGFENEADTVTVAPDSQRQPETQQMQLQPQPSQLIEVRDEGKPLSSNLVQHIHLIIFMWNIV